MKKMLTLMSLGLLVAGAAFAGADGDRLFVQPNLTFSGTTGTTGASGNVLQPAYAAGLLTGPSTTNNDDSCDISIMPAATLLLPYFEVDFTNPSSNARNTVFSITNTSPQPQIAHVTIWTDWSFPVIDFNLWLTGYDVVPVSLYDILRNGTIPVTGYRVSPIGSLSYDARSSSPGVRGTGGSASVAATTDYPFGLTGNPNHVQGVSGGVQDPLSGCGQLPGPIPPQLVTAMQDALTVGTYPGCTGRVGGQNAVATGYITIDVANKCSQLLPYDPRFFQQDILWDNTLIGDYMLLNSSTTTGNWAGGTPMVHIRAIPEGGPLANPVLGTPAFGGGTRAGAILTETNFPYTFYDRYTPATNDEMDRRQPLPAVFAARFIEDVATGPTGFDTRLIIWREGQTLQAASCASVPNTGGLSLYGLRNASIPAERTVRFDEQENPNLITGCQISPCPGESFYSYEESSAISTRNASFFPPDFATTADLGGWMYLNLNGAGDPFLGRPNDESQAWVAINMTAEGRYGVLYDAAALQNGCTPNPETQGGIIRPGPNSVPAIAVAD